METKNKKQIYNQDILFDKRDCEKYLNRKTPEAFIQEWTETISQPIKNEIIETLSILVFRLNNEWYAIKTIYFYEIINVKKMHYIPYRTNNIFKGLVNVNGELLLSFSLKNMLNIENTDKKQNIKIKERMIVLISENNYYVFKADEVKGIYNINKNIIKDTPATISKSSIVWSHGLIEIKQMNIGLLDEIKIFEGFNRSLT